jgi:hypothetical protein
MDSMGPTSEDPSTGTQGSSSESTADTSGSSSSASSESSGETTAGDESGTGTTTGGMQVCTPDPDNANGDAPVSCTYQADTDEFDPSLKWEYTGSDGDVHAFSPPLVANLTDDNDDGDIDLCDTPDVVVVMDSNWTFGEAGSLHVLDGETGDLHFRLVDAVQNVAVPALGDIDDDGLVEIVAIAATSTCNLVAFENDGTPKWTSDTPVAACGGSAVAVANLDGAGAPEIIAGNSVYDANGTFLFTAGTPRGQDAGTAADLDGDGDLEVIVGTGAWHHDGTVYWDASADLDAGTPYPLANYAHVGNLDDDDDPEVLIITDNYPSWGYWLFEHDGTVIFGGYLPGDEPRNPGALLDFDGDGVAESTFQGEFEYGVFEMDESTMWHVTNFNPEDSYSPMTGGGFDFLGTGTPLGIFSWSVELHVVDEQGESLWGTARANWGRLNHPTVADVDNDGAAELLYSARNEDDYAVRVIEDAEDRWVPAPRIYNQHTYHVTNIHEDGSIPVDEAHHWEHLNLFRAQTQVEVGGRWCTQD